MRWLGCLALAACAGGRDPRVLCSEALDHVGTDPTVGQLDRQLAIASEMRASLLVHGHPPLPVETIQTVIDLAARHHLPLVRYDELADHDGAVALAFDDNAVDDWFALRDLLANSGVHMTFFVSRFAQLPPAQVDELMQLAADGHELEPHTVNHLHPLAYVQEHGLDAWLADEVDPSIQILRDHGIEPAFFAYPFGERSDELDAAVLERVGAVRATGHYCKR